MTVRFMFYVTLCCLCMSSCNDSGDKNLDDLGDKMNVSTCENNIDPIIQTLKSMPAWSEVYDDNAKCDIIMKSLNIIKNKPLNCIRLAIESYMNELIQTNQYDVSSMSKLYVVNKFIFDLPESIPLDSIQFFGGWIGIPHDEDNINLLWPFSLDKNGKPCLTGSFGGYNGDSYLALQAFDYYNETFGKRK